MAPEQRPVSGPAGVGGAPGAADDVVVALAAGRARANRVRRRSGPAATQWAGILVGAVVVTALATYLLATQVESSASGGAARSRYFTGRAAERVVTDTVTAEGRVERQQETTVVPSAPDGAALIVTDLRARLGDALAEGAVPVVVSGRPVVVLQGGAPAYRDLAPGDVGADVGQLQEALRRLGFAVDDRSGPGGPTYGATTAAAVAALYERLGFSPTAASPDAVGQVRQAALAVADAQAALRSAQRALDQATPGTEADLLDARNAAARGVTLAQEAYADLVARSGAKLPRSEVVFVPEVPATVVQVPGRVGTALTAGEPALTVASGPVLVRAEVPSARRGEIRQGQRARLTLADGTTAGGVVAAVRESASTDGTTAPPPGSVSGPVTVEVVPDQPLADPPGSVVPVAVELAASDGPLLAVPVAAVQQRPDGSQRVRVVGDGRPRSVRVRVGVVGDGWVAVRPVGGGLTTGDRVVLGVRRSS